MQHSCTTNRKEAGFTLVELAIVMIIIGLLIGGILKGQELINNARIASTVANLKGISTAANTFRDQFSGFPGDFPVANVRLPNCAAAPCINGNGNNQVDGTLAMPVAPGAGQEGMSFFIHLQRADLLGGVDGTATAQFGQGLPASSIGGGHTVGFFAGGGALGNNGAARGGHYITIQAGPGAIAGAAANTGLGISTSEAARIDRKMDDGTSNAGSVFTANGACDAAAAAGTYDEANNPFGCEMYIRM